MTENTTTLAPTDAEIHDLADKCTPNTETGSLNYMDFARAILAKWGAPAPASGELVAEVMFDERKYIQYTIPLELLPVGAKFYTAPEVRVPLSDAEALAIVRSVPALVTEMTLDKERLRVLAEAVKGWSECNQAWLHAEISGLAVVGSISEGNQCPIAEIDADYYEHPGESLKLAEFYAGANPSAVLALLSEIAALEERERHALMAADAEAKLFDEERQKNAALAAEVERLRADHAAALGLVADVRFALGDNGKRMQSELIEWIKQRRNAGTQLANLAYNWSQREGHDLTGDDCELLRSLCQQWDAAMADKGGAQS